MTFSIKNNMKHVTTKHTQGRQLTWADFKQAIISNTLIIPKTSECQQHFEGVGIKISVMACLFLFSFFMGHFFDCRTMCAHTHIHTLLEPRLKTK